MMKKIMIIGPAQSGKSYLAHFLEGERERPLKKSQDVIYGRHTIDVPTAYIENRWMYRSIIAIAQNQACLMLLLHNQEAIDEDFYSPGFARTFTIPVLGVVTHVSVVNEATKKCERLFNKAGVYPPYYHLSSIEEDEDAWRNLAEKIKKKISL